MSVRRLGSGSIAVLGAMVVYFMALPVFSQEGPTTRRSGGEPLISEGLDAAGGVHLKANRTSVVTTSRPYKRVSVGQPDVIDFNAIAPTSILVTAKKPGTTQLIVWDEAERSQVVDVTVDADLKALQEQYQRVFPSAKIEVTMASGNVMLRGRVPNLEAADQAVQMAGPYGTKVLNFLEISGGQQVMLQVRFAEVSRQAVNALGINGAVADGAFVGANNIGQVNPLTEFTPGHVGDTPGPEGATFDKQSINSSVTLFGAGQIGSFYLQAFVAALRDNNLLRILAEPNLIATSGQEANFLAGGEFPIPVVQNGGGGVGGGTSISVEFKEFGVKLNFVPIVMGDGRIRLKVSPEVSELDFTTAVRFGGFVVPGLAERKVTTTIELSDGQSFAIAGLLSNSVTTTRAEVPLLGDLPVLGTLFRSVRYQRKETELVVLVTPRLVAPMNPDRVPALPGENWRHPTENELFWKRDLGGPMQTKPDAETRRSGERSAPLFYGQYGFAPATQPAAGPRGAD